MSVPGDLDIVMIGPFPTDGGHVEGGVQAAVFGLVRHLAESEAVARLEVVATPRRAGTVRGIVETRFGDVPVVRVGTPRRRLISSILHLPEVMRRITARPGRLVHLHGSGPFELGVLLGCRLKRVPVVWTLHGITEKETRDALRRAPSFGAAARWLVQTVCERLQCRLCPSPIVDTPYVARVVAARSGATPVVLPQGIDLAELSPLAARPRLDELVVSIGVFHPRKGHDRTIDAFARVAARRPGARLEVIGAADRADCLAALEAQVARAGLGDRVRLRPDLPRAELLDALGRARLYVLHSEEESQGIAVCEAMAAGLPVVVTSAGGLPDVVGESGAGVCVAVGDVEGFAAAIEERLSDESVRSRAAAAAVERASVFDWSRVVAAMVAHYRAALDAARRPRPATADTAADRSRG